MHAFRFALIPIFFSWFLYVIPHESVVLDTLYGTDTVHEPVLIELINSKAMQRLKQINQYGVVYFIKSGQDYTRYEHSIGVLFLLRHFGASLDEQVMGLLHDVSHAPFSHVMDYVMGTALDKYSYQDKIFGWYLQNTDIFPILEKYDYTWVASLGALESVPMLKSDLPSLCADRLEYNLYGGYIEHLLTKDEILHIVDALSYDNNQWIFGDAQSARSFAQVAVELNSRNWCSAWNYFVYTETALVLKRALEIGSVTMDDLTFAHDAHIWSVLNASDDPHITRGLSRIKAYDSSFCLVGDKDAYDFHIRGKFRGIDPLVQGVQGIVHLSEIDSTFKGLFDCAQQNAARGVYIRYRQ